MTTAPTINVTAYLVPDITQHVANLPGSWYITHGLGKPAAGTFTEVAFGDNALIDADGQPWPEWVLDAAVRHVAGQLYGDRWAFQYRPDQYEPSIERHGMRRRERVVITNVEVWT